MKIVGNSPAESHTAAAPLAPVAASAAEAAKAHAAATTSATPAAPDASARIQLSSTASTLLAGGNSAEFDADKVARVSEMVAKGSFKVNADVIADKLIANAQELLSKVSR